MNGNKPLLESTICKNIQRRLLAIPGCYVEKRHGGMYTTAGRPDLSGCYQGRRFEIEVKRPGGTLTDLQFIELLAWRAVGAKCGVVTTERDAIYVVSNRCCLMLILLSQGIILPKIALQDDSYFSYIPTRS